MSDFGCMEDWDLQAVVRGCINEARPTIFGNPKSCFAPLSAVEDDLLSFPEISETATVLDELDKLYKPLIYPALQPVPSQTILASSVSVPKEIKKPEQKPSIKEPRRRKNQHKRVVQHVTAAEGLCSDMWAWRKYGQKPIKGSPYPRSYYRCSSSKGCSARKQVERSHLEPGVFIVTYTSEHNHTRPTRRNSLAGSTRSKFPTPKRKNNSPSSSKVLSPTTPLMQASIEDEFVQSASLKKEEEQMVQENENNGTFNMPDMILDSDIDLFPSLEDFDELAAEPAMDGCFLDQLLDNFPVPWFFERSTAVSDGH
ncbi:probable WRKY transcription factor 29 isoform X2 [Juglans microcarpa x Juglans regia]|uniref:probable WRKY transcription factor 29 isoform X2 n=1 Tax=Juglans microcarpa x Juglans regia TaxID=2249226 RepID=UPI001B7DFC63|nr:probable WRKY transcription factor 29 isoform X2 [Juglans microcarpa x Juglans regia]